MKRDCTIYSWHTDGWVGAEWCGLSIVSFVGHEMDEYESYLGICDNEKNPFVSGKIKKMKYFVLSVWIECLGYVGGRRRDEVKSYP